MNIKNYINKLKENQRSNRSSYILVTILKVLVLLIAIRQIITGNYEAAATCILVMILFFVPAAMENKLKMQIPALFEGIIYVFIFAAEILGEVNHFYIKIHGWDTMLHTMNGFLCAAVGFSLVYLLNRNHRNIKLTPFYMTLMAFCFSMTVGVIWEFFECSADLFMGADMQKDFIVQSFQSVTLDPSNSQQVIPVEDIVSTTIHTKNGDIVVEGGYLDIGILDTMKDLFVNFIGAVVFCAMGFIYCVEEEKGKIHTRRGNFAKGMMLKAEYEEDDASADSDEE